jgi:hypothetical protein
MNKINKNLQDFQHQALYKMVVQLMDIYQEYKNLYDTTKKKMKFISKNVMINLLFS